MSSPNTREIYLLIFDLQCYHSRLVIKTIRLQAFCPLTYFLGDAAHVMCPFAGVGANVSMEDSLELARSIIKRKHEGKKAMVVDAVKEYEKSMFVRAEENATLTRRNMLRAFEGAAGQIEV